MSYGLEITGTDGTTEFLVMDSNLNPDNYQVVATGTASSVDLASSAFGSGGEARLYFKPLGSGVITTASVSGTTYNFKRYNITEDGSGNVIEATTTTQSVSYMVLKDVRNAPVNSSMGDYGLQIFKANGDKAFDSQRIQQNNSFRLLGVVGRGSVGGDISTTASTISGPSADVANYYVEASTLFNNPGSTSGNVHGFSVVGSGSSSYLRHSFINWSEGDGGGGGGRPNTNLTYYISNQYPIVYGELRQ